MKSKRIDWIDITKGIAILLVLYGHSMRDEMRLASPLLDYTYRCVYIFHMAFFFWLSGYSYQMGRSIFHKSYDAHFIYKKIKKQCLPWIFYTLFIYIVFSLTMHFNSLASILKNAGYEQIPLPQYLINALCANNSWAYHLWFIYVLFLISIIIFCFEQIQKRRLISYYILMVLCFIGLLCIRLFRLGNCERLLNYLFLYIPFYLLGILMQGKENLIKRTKLWGVLGLIYILLRAKFWSGFSGNSVETNSLWSEMAVWYAAYFFLPGCFLMMRKIGIRLSKSMNRIVTFLRKCGKESFVIYLFHQPFCCAFIGTVLYNKMNINPICVMAVCIVFSLIISALIMYLYNILNKFKLTLRM